MKGKNPNDLCVLQDSWIGSWEISCVYCDSITHIVIGVQHPGDVLSQVSVQHGLNVVSDVN